MASEKIEANCEGTKTEDASAVENKDTQNSVSKDSAASPNTEEPKQSSDEQPTAKENSADVDTSGEKLSNFAIDILKSVFEAAGHSPEYEGSFADAGNPVMALVSSLYYLLFLLICTVCTTQGLRYVSAGSIFSWPRGR